MSLFTGVLFTGVLFTGVIVYWCHYLQSENVSIKDLHNQRVTMPTLEYHNKNWTWTDMLMEVKKDYKTAIVQQTIKSAIGMKRSDDVAGLVSPKMKRHVPDTVHMYIMSTAYIVHVYHVYCMYCACISCLLHILCMYTMCTACIVHVYHVYCIYCACIPCVLHVLCMYTVHVILNK